MITFPTTPEAFVAYQEKGINRTLDDFEQKLSCAVVDLANISYQEGLDGEENSITIETGKESLRLRGKEDNKKFLHIWESICWWCDRAYMAGKEAAQ